jgi:adenylosuccinate lyase
MRQHTLTSRRGAHGHSPLADRTHRTHADPTSLTAEWATRRWQQRVEAEARRELKREIHGISAGH